MFLISKDKVYREKQYLKSGGGEKSNLYVHKL